MLAHLAYSHCSGPEEFKAWSQNLGHESPLTTFTSYGTVATDRQGELVRSATLNGDYSAPPGLPSGGGGLVSTVSDYMVRPWRDALRAKHGIETCRELAEVLLSEQQIATLPGSDFGSAPHHLAVRLSTSQLHALSEGNADRVLTLAGRQVPDEEFRRAACPDLEAAGDRLARFVNSLTKARLAS